MAHGSNPFDENHPSNDLVTTEPNYSAQDEDDMPTFLGSGQRSFKRINPNAPKAQPIVVKEIPMKVLPQRTSIKKDLHEIKPKIQKAVESFEDKDHSYIAQLSEFVGPKPFWAKGLIGASIFILLVVVSILAGPIAIAITAIATAFLFVAYSVSSYFLTDHYHANKKAMNKLKGGIGEYADMHVSMISELDSINDSLHTEVEKIGHENIRYSENLDSLSREDKFLQSTNRELSGIEKNLNNIVNEKLSTTTSELSLALHKTRGMLDEHKEQMVRREHEYASELDRLKEQVHLLSETNVALSLQVKESQQECQQLSLLTRKLQNIETQAAAEEQKQVEQMEQLYEKSSNQLCQTNTRFGEQVDTLSKLNEKLSIATGKFMDLQSTKQEKTNDLLENFGIYKKQQSDTGASVAATLEKTAFVN